MALIKCPECGKEISRRAEACPFCGCPINEETMSDENGREESGYLQNATDVVGGIAKSAFNKVKEASSYKRVGALEVDETNRRFKVLKTANKDGVGAKILKGTAALYTAGLSLAAEKAYKAVSREWYSFDDLISYKTEKDNAREYISSGSKTSLFKGVSTRRHSGSAKTVTRKASIILKMNSLDEPTIEIPIITKPLAGAEFNKATALLRDTEAALDYIIKNKKR